MIFLFFFSVKKKKKKESLVAPVEKKERAFLLAEGNKFALAVSSSVFRKALGRILTKRKK